MDRSHLSKHFKAAVMRAQVGGFEPVIDSKTGTPKKDANGEPVLHPVIRFHDLRHTFATLVARQGDFTMSDLQQYMGHADLKTTLVYSHYQPNKRAAELIEKAFTSDAVELMDAAQPNALPGSLAGQIKSLAGLHASGILTDDEFADAKGALLARL